MTGFPCCCDALSDCPNCDTDTIPSSVTVTFGAGTNSAGDKAGCDVDCDDFAAAWELPQLSQAQVDSLDASCSNAFTDQPNPVAGCYYGETENLPCGVAAIILEILDGGTAGLGEARGAVTICWASEWVRLDWDINTDDSDQDCITNIDTNGGGIDNLRNYSDSTGEPCDFLGVFGDITLLDIVANA